MADVPESVMPNDCPMGENDDWAAQWWEGDLQWMVSTQKKDCPHVWTQEDNTDSKITEHPSRQAIIDTGAIGSVDGLKWLEWRAWAQFRE